MLEVLSFLSGLRAWIVACDFHPKFTPKSRFSHRFQRSRSDYVLIHSNTCLKHIHNVQIYIYIPRTSGYAKLTLDLETTLIIDVSFVYRRFPEKTSFQIRALAGKKLP